MSIQLTVTKTLTKTLKGFDEMSDEQIIDYYCDEPADFFDDAQWDIKRDSGRCICPKECDCEYRGDGSGFRGNSKYCPKHNTYPDPLPECLAEVHG